AHSLGVTLVRQWMRQTNQYHRVRHLVAVAGANNGVATARADARGQNRVVALELAADSRWLQQLNGDGETPGPTRYMTLYDGSGWYDAMYPERLRDSPALDGAFNLALNRERGHYFDHRELAQAPEAL